MKINKKNQTITVKIPAALKAERPLCSTRCSFLVCPVTFNKTPITVCKLDLGTYNDLIERCWPSPGPLCPAYKGEKK